MRDQENGGMVRELFNVFEGTLPQRVVIEEPGTGVIALAVLGKDGLRAIPSSNFDSYRTRPRFRNGTAKLASLDSLIDHANRFKDKHSAIFAIPTRGAPEITIVLDYHESCDDLKDGTPRFGAHRGHYAFPLSDEWTAWTKFNGKSFALADFAAFLEERIVDVTVLIPGEDELAADLQKFIHAAGGDAGIASPEKLMELSRGLAIHESSALRESRKLQSGEGELSFVSEHKDATGKPLKVPGLFLIGIPIFKHGVPYRIPVRLRYRKTQEGVNFIYEMWRADKAFDHAFTECCERVEAATGLPLFYGQPE